MGRVNGLAVMGADTGITEFSGVLIQIVADVTPAASREEGKIIATGKLGDIAKEAGIKRVIIPIQNLRDVLIDKKYQKKIEIIPVETIQDVLNVILTSGPKKDGVISKLLEIVPKRKRKKLILPITNQKKGRSKLPYDPSIGIDAPRPTD